MSINRELIDSARLNPLTLRFENARLEQFYRQHDLPRLRLQARIALLLGAVLYGVYGVMDFLFIPTEDYIKALYIHIMALIIAFCVFGLSYTKSFINNNQILLCVAGFFAGLGLLGKMTYLSNDAINFFYAGIIVITFWCHTFSGLRFLLASIVGLSLLILFNLMFHQLPFWAWFSHNFFIISANILGSFASYTSEKQHRRLFLREQELDIERKHQQERALHDRLTGLPNRELLHDRIEQAINFAERNDQICAGLFLDLDNFKPINDTYGHAVGDLVLQEVTSRFKEVMRESDTLARLGGDEFFVLAKNIQSSVAAKMLAEKLIQQLEIPIKVGKSPPITNLSASVGIVMFPYRNATAIDLIRKADHAMYDAKRQEKTGIVLLEV